MNLTTIKPSEASSALQCCIEARQPVMLWGNPGIGKSAITQQLADSMSRIMFDIRAVLLDPVDLRGIPNIVNGQTRFNPPAFLPDGSLGATLISLEELNRAPELTQNGLLQLVLDRRLGEYRLPDNCEIVACCNDVDSGLRRMSQALLNRFIHLHMVVDGNDLSAHAVSANWEPVVIAFLRFRPALIHVYDGKDKSFPSPRTWEFVSRVLARKPSKNIMRALICGAVGEGAGLEFLAFMEQFLELAQFSIDGILLDPMSSPVPDSPAANFAVASALARVVTVKNVGRVFKYLARMREEYHVFSVLDAIRLNGALKATPDFQQWAIANQGVLS